MMKIYQELVDFFGDQHETAKKLNVKQPSVSAWVRGVAKMSPLVAMRAERVTEGVFKASDLSLLIKDEILLSEKSIQN